MISFRIPNTANRYWWKVLTPSFEFGVMHVVLFQMALIPLTMSRHLVTVLGQTLLNKLIPFSKILQMHVYLGYLVVALVFASSVIFLAFFGLVCQDEKDGIEPTPRGRVFCDKFQMEIMITGYAIIGMLLIVGLSSYMRHVIPYEVFYALHHIFIAIYAVTIAHTFDAAVGIQLTSSCEGTYLIVTCRMYVVSSRPREKSDVQVVYRIPFDLFHRSVVHGTMTS
jgi:predicted ferric reductase